MAEDQYLSKWRDIRFAFSTETGPSDIIVLLFDDLETGRNAIRFIQSWGYITIAFVKKSNGGIDIHLYDDTNPNKYSLITRNDTVWERDDVDDFIKNRPNNIKTPIVCGAYYGEDLKSTEPDEGFTVYVNGYVYTDEKNFRYQRLSDRN